MDSTEIQSGSPGPYSPGASVAPPATSKDLAPAITTANLEVVVLNTAEELCAREAQWQQLADDAMDPNIFFEPAVMLAALSAFPPEGKGRFVFIQEKQSADHGRRFHGFFPLMELGQFHRLPMKTLYSWHFVHCFLGTPLVRPDFASLVMTVFVDWLQKKSGRAVVEFRNIGEGATAQLLKEKLAERKLPTWEADTHQRAFFLPRDTFDAYVQSAMSTRHYKGILRLERRLGETGKLQFTTLDQESEIDAWIERFLELESRGWKGENKTALNSDDANRRFFIQALHSLKKRNRLMLIELTLDGRPIAMKCNFLCRNGSYAFKIAFDETLRHYSPGVLMEMENVRLLQLNRTTPWMDSCADENHIMINRLWTDRKRILTFAASTGGIRGNLAVRALPKLRDLYAKLKKKPEPETTPGHKAASEETEV